MAAGLVVIYVTWGSAYVGVRFVVQEVPALLSIGVRYLLAGLALAALLAARHGLAVLRIDRTTVVGLTGLALLLQVLTNGTVTLAESLGVQAGPAALLSALAPVGIVCLRATTGDRPSRATLLGVGAGFVGLAVLLLGGQSVPGFPLVPSLLVVASASCWALGSFLQPTLHLPSNTFVTTAYQMLIGGLVLTVTGILSGERPSIELRPLTWLVLTLLTVSSIVSFSIFIWLLDHAPVSLVSTHAYINPVVAVVLGWLWLGEPITWPVLIGGGVVILAVGLVMTEGHTKPSRTPLD